MRGIEIVDHVCKIPRKYVTVFHNFKPLGLLFHKLGQGLEVRKICKDGRRAVHSKDRWAGFKWLCCQQTGVWLVRLLQNVVVDLCVCVHPRRGLIYDSEEEYPVRPTSNTLVMCGGDGIDRLKVVDIRKVVFFQECYPVNIGQR